MDILTEPSMTSNNGKRVAILATDGFEESELRAPREALLQAGAIVDLISLEAGAIKGWKDGNWGDTEQVDRTVADAKAEDYDTASLTRLPITYASWWQSEANQLKAEAVLEVLSESAPLPAFRIVSPLEGTVAFIDPDLPGNGARFPLKIAGSGREEIEWSSESLPVESDGAESWLILKPGEHEVLALDRKSGREAKTRLTVQAL